jgi:hypothetical protein
VVRELRVHSFARQNPGYKHNLAVLPCQSLAPVDHVRYCEFHGFHPCSHGSIFPYFHPKVKMTAERSWAVVAYFLEIGNVKS